MVIVTKPAPLSLSGNLDKFKLSADSNVSFVLSQGNDVILSSVYTPGADNSVEIDVRDIIHSRLQFHFKDVKEVYEQTSLVADFKALIDTEEYTFRVIRCGVDNLATTPPLFLQANFLTWQKQVKKVTYYTPEYLTYYAVSNCTVKVRAFIPGDSGELSTKDITYASLLSGKAYTIPVSYPNIESLCDGEVPGAYDVWVEDASGNRLSYVQRYMAGGIGSEEEQWFMFENSLGGIDTFRAYGATAFTGEHTHNIAEMGDTSVEYRVDTERKFNKSTGYLDKKERHWLLDFFPSQRKYIYATNYLRQIVVVESNVEYESHELPSEFKFTYKYADAKPFLNMQRVEVPELLTIKSPDLMSFTIPPRLIDFPSQPLSEGALFPVQNPFSEQWSTTTIGAILLYVLNSISENYDGDGGVGHIHSNKGLLDSLSYLKGYLLASGVKINAGYADNAGDVSDDSPLFEKVLRKDIPDTAAELITFLRGILIGENGSGITVLPDGTTQAVVDRLDVKLKAIFDELEVKKKTHVGGEFVVSPSGMKCIKVEELDDAYRCYFLSAQDGVKIENDFTVGALAISQKCNLKEGVSEGTSTHFYWRLVTAVGEDYIDLSKTVCLEESDIPKVGDDIAGFGHNTDVTRQSAIIISAVNENSPSIIFYEGINSFSTVGKESITLGFNRVTGKAYIKVYGDAYIGAKDRSTYFEYTPENGVVIKGKFYNESGKDLGNSLENLSIDIESIKKQTDKEFTMWYYAYEPTLSNLPASDWTDDLIKSEHVGDLFYNEDTGFGYTFSVENGIYYWKDITDKQTVKALENAAKAQDTADGKRRTFVSQPTNDQTYDVGDLWVNATYEDADDSYENDTLVCRVAKNAGDAFSIAHWQPSSFATRANIVNTGKELILEVQGNVNEMADSLSSINVKVNGIDSVVKKINIDETGKITNIDKSGLLLESDFANLFTAAVDADGNIVKSADIIAFVTMDDVEGAISNLEFSADQINFLGKTIINGNFEVDLDGNVKLNNVIATNITASGKIKAGGGSKFGLLKVLSNGALEGANYIFENSIAPLLFTNTGSTSYQSIIIDNIGKAASFLMYSSNSVTYTINLPDYTEVASKIGEGVSGIFEMKIIIPALVSTTSAINNSTFRITSKTNAQIYDNNGNATSYIDLAKGDVLELVGNIISGVLGSSDPRIDYYIKTLRT